MVKLRPSFAILASLLVAGVAANVIAEKRAAPEPWESLAGRSQDEIEAFISAHKFKIVGSQPNPPLPADVSAKLVNDAAHPYKAPGPRDTRGPCPAMNTLANHGVGRLLQKLGLLGHKR